MEKQNIDWSALDFSYRETDKSYVSNFKNGKWDDGVLTSDHTITMSECAGVLQYSQSVFEGMITESQLHKMQEEVRRKMNVKEDQMCIYELHSLKYTRKEVIGNIEVKDNYL